MFLHSTTVRVRYGETDQMGYVYYGNYAYFYEIGRVEAMRSIGLRYADFESKLKILMPVMTLESRFVRPARYDDLLTLETRITSLPVDTIKFRTDIFNEHRKLVNSGTVKLFFLNSISGERVKAPEEIVKKLKPYFET